MPSKKKPNEKHFGALTIRRAKETHVCSNHCNTHDRGASMGRDHLSIAGWPMGWFCPTCVKTMTQTWQSASCNWETDVPTIEHRGLQSDQLAA
jgi:hypothetical protein